MRGSQESDESVLIDEYQQPEAIEAELEPEQKVTISPTTPLSGRKRQPQKPEWCSMRRQRRRKRSRSMTRLALSHLLPDLVGLLIRFHELPAAIQANIRKAFFMIGVRKEDRCFLRFGWLNQEGETIPRRLSKLPFGVNCSPHILSTVVQHHLEEEKQSRPA